MYIYTYVYIHIYAYVYTITDHTQMDVLPAHLNRDSFRDSFKGLVALEIKIDLPIGFPINNIISLSNNSTGGSSSPSVASSFLRRIQSFHNSTECTFQTISLPPLG